MWRWFDALDAARTGNGWAANAITFTEIDAWSRLTGVRLEPWELRALRSMDGTRLSIMDGEVSGVGQPEVSERPLTPDLFDALFP